MAKSENTPNTFHHYVPQCYLRQFGFQKDNKKKKDFFVNAFDKQTGKIYPKGVEKVCGEDFFYKLNLNSIQDTNVDEMYLEVNYFANQIESELSRLLNFMERHLLSAVKDTYGGLVIPQMGRNCIAKHLAIQFLRHPIVRDYDFKLLDEIDSEITGFITRNNLQDNPGAKEYLDGKNKYYDDVAMTHAQLSFMNDELITAIMNALANNIWVYYYSPNGDFFACDSPIHVTPHVKGDVPHTLMGLNQYGAEVTWTLNPYFTLSIYDKEYFSENKSYDNCIIPCSEDTLRHYNIIRYGCAKKYVFSKSRNFEHANICFITNKIFNIQK